MTYTHSCTLTLAVALTVAAAAQTAPKPASPAGPHRPATAATAHPGAAACVKVPELSPKIPALPADSACPKALYTISTIAPVKLEYVSPIEGSDIRETLGLDTTTFSLAYVDTKIGAGPLAAPHKYYSIHYTGYLVDGTKFDSSLDRGKPINIAYGQHQVIPGWDTGFGGMHVGGKRRLFIPYQLAYGPNGHPPSIPAKAELIFDVELVAQSDENPEPAPAPPVKPATPPPAAKPATPSTGAPPAGTDQPKADAKPATPPPAQTATPDAAAKPATPK